MMKTLTRLFLSLAVTCCLFAQNASAQNIPDPNFADAIREVCPTCIDVNDNLTPAAQNLDSLDVSDSDISNLTGIGGFISLKSLFCWKNQLSFLPALPNTLTYLNCISNQLNSLPTLPDDLKFVDCGDNQLDSLPELPEGLATLNCPFNQLSSLPALPDSLTFLDCGYNQLSSLPSLPEGLKDLYCEKNQLSSLPALPDNLRGLYCWNNQLSSLPALPDSLRDLYCYDNQLSFLPVLPDSLRDLFCQNNPSLSCLPVLPNGLTSLITLGTQITCIPNQPTSLIFMLPSLPLCSESCDSSVSTSNIFAAKPFTVQPNPVSDILQVRFSADYEANADFRLLNANGQIVRALSGKGDVEIPVGDLPEGVYWLEVRGAGQVFGEKILKR